MFVVGRAAADERLGQVVNLLGVIEAVGVGSSRNAAFPAHLSAPAVLAQ
jgi:hypothetical protein